MLGWAFMLRAALIGFPSSGKTTLFQLMTSIHEAPRGKGDVNIGISKVPDELLDKLTAMYNPKKRVPATVEFTDIVAAARGGAQALVDVAGYKNADALVHVVRAFRDPSVAHPSGSIDPSRDAQTMEDELILADLGVAERRLERIEKDLKRGKSAELEKERDLVQRCKDALEHGTPLRALQLAGAAEMAGLTAFLAHASTRAVALCTRIELEISQLEAADATAFLSDLGLTESGLDRVIRTSYDLLGYISFFTVGEDECRAWSIARGTPAQLAAGEIHTDIQRGFIRAEVVAYDALIARGSMAACREHGEVRLEGKEYIVLDGDIINFRHAT